MLHSSTRAGTPQRFHCIPAHSSDLWPFLYIPGTAHFIFSSTVTAATWKQLSINADLT